MIDLDALRKVVERATGWGWEAAYQQDVTALVAEVERLQSYAADCEQHAKFAASKATTLERQNVVAWLREHGDQRRATLADRIERGEHRRKENE